MFCYEILFHFQLKNTAHPIAPITSGCGKKRKKECSSCDILHKNVFNLVGVRHDSHISPLGLFDTNVKVFYNNNLNNDFECLYDLYKSLYSGYFMKPFNYHLKNAIAL